MSSEAEAQQQIRLRAGIQGTPLMRNNSGACLDNTGRMIRYGLGNDSSKVNKTHKSSDLVGIWPLVVQPCHVGMTLGLFWGVEVKSPGWKKPKNDRDRAQERWGEWVRSYGGLFMFATKPEDIWNG